MVVAVAIDRVAGTFTLAGALWSDSAPLTRLPLMLAFYRALKERGDKGKDGRTWGHFYAETVAALESAAQEAGYG